MAQTQNGGSNITCKIEHHCRSWNCPCPRRTRAEGWRVETAAETNRTSTSWRLLGVDSTGAACECFSSGKKLLDSPGKFDWDFVNKTGWGDVGRRVKIIPKSYQWRPCSWQRQNDPWAQREIYKGVSAAAPGENSLQCRSSTVWIKYPGVENDVTGKQLIDL